MSTARRFGRLLGTRLSIPRIKSRVYDLRHTYASNWLAGIWLFELSKAMGTSVAMIERSTRRS